MGPPRDVFYCQTFQILLSPILCQLLNISRDISQQQWTSFVNILLKYVIINLLHENLFFIPSIIQDLKMYTFKKITML